MCLIIEEDLCMTRFPSCLHKASPVAGARSIAGMATFDDMNGCITCVGAFSKGGRGGIHPLWVELHLA